VHILKIFIKLFNFKFWRYFFNKFSSYVRNNYKTFKFLTENTTLKIEEDVQIKSLERLYIGKNIILQKGTILHCGGMNWSDYKGKIIIGDDSVISPNCIFYGAGEIEIGKRFDCGPNVMIFSSRTDYNFDICNKNTKHLFKKVKIGNDVIIFANVVINIGVKIGDRAVIGASSLVLNDIPEDEIWAGVPAKFIKRKSFDKNK